METLYERILYLCKSKGVTGGKMCVDLQMSKSTLTELKMGRQKSLSAEKAQKIASYLGVSVAHLLGEETKKDPGEEITEVDQQLYELLKQIPEEQKKLFLEMGRVFVNNLNKG